MGRFQTWASVRGRLSAGPIPTVASQKTDVCSSFVTGSDTDDYVREAVYLS